MALVECDHFVDRDGVPHARRRASSGSARIRAAAAGTRSRSATRSRSTRPTSTQAAPSRGSRVADHTSETCCAPDERRGGRARVREEGRRHVRPRSTIPIRVRFGAPSVIESKADGTTSTASTQRWRTSTRASSTRRGLHPRADERGGGEPVRRATDVRVQSIESRRCTPRHDEGVVEYFVDGTSDGRRWILPVSPVSALISTKPATPLGEYTGFGHARRATSRRCG